MTATVTGGTSATGNTAPAGRAAGPGGSSAGFTGLQAGMAVLALGMAAGVAWGLSRRLAEHR